MIINKSIVKRHRDLRVTTRYFCKLRTYNSIHKIDIPTYSPKIQTQTFKFQIKIKDKMTIKIFLQMFSIFYHYFLGKTTILKFYKVNFALPKIRINWKIKKIKNRSSLKIAIKLKAKILISTRDV